MMCSQTNNDMDGIGSSEKRRRIILGLGKSVTSAHSKRDVNLSMCLHLDTAINSSSKGRLLYG